MNLADALNLGCLCSTLQPDLLRQALDDGAGLPGTAQEMASSHPNLFSATPVYICAADYARMETSVAALERVIALPGYQAQALRRAPAIASRAFGPRGVFMGYDFHLSEGGPRLIEINTNAGGAFLHTAALQAHRSCCEPMDHMFDTPAGRNQLAQGFVDMFRSEWQAQRGGAPLRSIAIVDDDPGGQYLAPEFELARELFLAHGIQAVITDPRQLEWRNGALWHPGLADGVPVNLVYNRLTDFYLSEPGHAALREAYETGAAVVTPHPRAHALHADKRNLVALSDDARLAGWGASSADRAVLAEVVPRTQLVTAENAEALWAQRRQLFFKPATGFGSRAAYRGDKLTRRVWDEIQAAPYVAQALVPPSERMVNVAGAPTRLKLDIRAYAYDGQIQLLAARTYAGQTTNFRTAGGGFSPVVVLPAATDKLEIESSEERAASPA
ncbi:MAG TPA: hypothetical protein VKP68_14090 [Ramlibacter sp.]|nr:hypothetical protein [Ramlibacter sp.]